MECKKIIILTDSDVLHSWCAEELHGISDVTVVSFRNLTVSINSLFDAFDAVVVDYSLENLNCISDLYEFFCKSTLQYKKKFIILYDSYSHIFSNLKLQFRNAELFNLISPVHALRKLFENEVSVAFFRPEMSVVTPMEELEEKLRIVAGYDECVLLLGESGSGKTWAAKKIHQYSRRCKERFFNVNVAEFNPNLIEGNLFGINSGAFTGAVSQKGCFEEADKGTLLLDEIGELPISLQSKLLSVIENRMYKRLGSTKECYFDEKLIFATNKNLDECVKNHTFRSDLFYRINCLTLYIPPLRSHKDDIPSLAKQFSSEHKKCLSSTAIEKLCNYSWPGNIRELKNVVKRACFFSGKELLTAEDILFSYYG